MFIEPYITGNPKGWIEVICGGMFSGKTEELIRRLKRAKIANLKVEIFKPATDNRYAIHEVVSHDANQIPSKVVLHARDILSSVDKMEVVGIDEAQFFDHELISVCQEMANRGIRVIVAGLDMDYRGIPFEPIPALLAVAEYITKVHAICPHCGQIATYSYRLVDFEETVLVGEKQHYEPRCRNCFNKGMLIG
ncbi:MAG: thymidine kinase [Bacteroidetes bacterium]|nr:thymidine kinase [Bacteroidota bacterium]